MKLPRYVDVIQYSSLNVVNVDRMGISGWDVQHMPMSLAQMKEEEQLMSRRNIS
jgi:hypothetical protein